MINNFFDPKVLFALWYLVPGFVTVFLTIKFLEIIYPSSKIRYSKLGYIEKIILTFLCSTVIFIVIKYPFNEFTLSYLINNSFSVMVALSIPISIILVFFFVISISLVMSVGLSCIYVIDFFKKLINGGKEFYIDEAKSVGAMWDMGKRAILSAYKKKEEIILILKNNQKLTGFASPSGDFSEISIINKKGFETIIKFKYIGQVILDHTKIDRVPYNFYKNLLLSCFWYFIIGFMLLYHFKTNFAFLFFTLILLNMIVIFTTYFKVKSLTKKS